MNGEAVDRLFAAALDLAAGEREALLRSETDEAVRRAVQRLLDRHDALEAGAAAAGFLAGLDLQLAAQLVDTDADDPAAIGRFTVLRRLGTGATGAVYLAHDPDLDRDVAIKVLAEDLGGSPAAAQRFAEEARAASGLDHPHVVTVFETGRTDEGRFYIVMAYHEGETLRQRLERGSLALEEALPIAVAVCDGLAAAHARGVVHCDIKPENILLTARGAKIVDFGIARAAGRQGAGGGFGTAAYMSPEQTRGEAVDPRTDIWSLGVVLHEMLSGTRPFQASRRDALVTRIREEAAAALAETVPAPVAAIVDRCLRKSPSERYQSADALLAALRAAAALGGPRPPAARFVGSRAAMIGAAIMAVVLTAAAAGLRYWPGGDGAAEDRGPAPGVAVLPWRVVGPDVEYLGEGMVDLLSFGVEGVAGLRKIVPSTVLSAWRAYRGDSLVEVDEAAGLEIAHRVQARYLITGSVVQSGQSVRMVAEVRDVTTGRPRGLAEVTGPLDSVPLLVDRLTLELLRLGLLPADTRALPVNLGSITTASLPALKAYLAGEREYRVAHWYEAAHHYLRALEHDSTFAYALYRLIKANDWGANLGSTRPYRERLAPLVARMPERDRMLITGEMAANIWPDRPSDPGRQIEMLEAMVRRYPDDVEGWVALGDRHYHDRGPLLLPPDGYRGAFARAMALNPHFREPYLHLIEDAFSRLDTVEARRLLAAASAIAGSAEHCTYQVAYDLGWGSAGDRERAMALLDSVPLAAIWRDCLPTTAPIPASAEVREKLRTVYQRVADRVELRTQRFGAFNVLRTGVLLPQGRIRELRRALAEYEDRTPPESAWPERWQLVLHLIGFRDAVAADRAARVLATTDHLTGRFWVGLFAIEEARWEDADRETAWLERRADELDASGDAAAAYAARTHAAGLRAYQVVAREPTAELAALEAILPRIPRIHTDQPQAVLRYLTGKLLIDRGELEQARRYFESFGQIDHFGTLAGFQLGRIAERQGRHPEAAEHYRRFLAWYRDADPELQPLVEEARQGIAQADLASREPVTPE